MTRAWTALAVGAGLGMQACGDSTGPTVTAIDVTSPIGDRLAVGRTVQLDAAASDAGGLPLDATYTWQSSAPAAATVSGTGLVSGIAPGSATITASAAGVEASLTLEVLAADLDGIGTTVDDAFLLALVAGLTSQPRGRVQAAVDACRDGVTAGDFDSIEQCLADTRAEVGGAADPTDQALLAALALFVDHIERLLG